MPACMFLCFYNKHIFGFGVCFFNDVLVLCPLEATIHYSYTSNTCLWLPDKCKSNVFFGFWLFCSLLLFGAGLLTYCGCFSLVSDGNSCVSRGDASSEKPKQELRGSKPKQWADTSNKASESWEELQSCGESEWTPSPPSSTCGQML